PRRSSDLPGGPLLPRREDPYDRRGHRRGPADGDRPRARRVRLVALWAVLFAVYVAGIGIDPRSGDELVRLRIAQTLARDGEIDDAPQGAGFALLITPARELGGARAVELVLAAVAALGVVLAALLARR